jgi:hypothetical protein
MILLGAQMFTTGLLGEMIVRPRMKKTATYQVSATAEGRGSSAGERGNGSAEQGHVSERVVGETR